MDNINICIQYVYTFIYRHYYKYIHTVACTLS